MAAGDYIPIRNNISQDPRVLAVAINLKVDVDTIVGKLHRVWTIASENSVDGTLRVMSHQLFDSIMRLDGLAKEMMSIGWLALDEKRGLYCPNFEQWQESTSLKRAKEREKKRRQRMGKSVPGTNKGHVGTTKGQTRDHVPNTDTDIDIEINTPKPPTGAGNGFERVWKTYPSHRRGGRKPALKIWERDKLEPLADKIVSHIASAKTSEQWAKGFIPGLKVYLNQQRWDSPVDPQRDDCGGFVPKPLTETERQEIAALERELQGVTGG